MASLSCALIAFRKNNEKKDREKGWEIAVREAYVARVVTVPECGKNVPRDYGTVL